METLRLKRIQNPNRIGYIHKNIFYSINTDELSNFLIEDWCKNANRKKLYENIYKTSIPDSNRIVIEGFIINGTNKTFTGTTPGTMPASLRVFVYSDKKTKDYEPIEKEPVFDVKEQKSSEDEIEYITSYELDRLEYLNNIGQLPSNKIIYTDKNHLFFIDINNFTKFLENPSEKNCENLFQTSSIYGLGKENPRVPLYVGSNKKDSIMMTRQWLTKTKQWPTNK